MDTVVHCLILLYLHISRLFLYIIRPVIGDIFPSAILQIPSLQVQFIFRFYLAVFGIYDAVYFTRT